MNCFIEIIKPLHSTDADGFKHIEDVVIADVRAYREGRHGSERWANRASFTSATDLFRFRVIPGVEITTDMKLVTGGHIFEIKSAEDVKGKGMYIEVLAEEVKPSGKSNV